MRRLLIPCSVAVVAVGLVGLLIFGVLQTTADTTIDQAVAAGDRPVAPDARLELLDGSGTLALGDLRGKVVVVNFFASWCPPCIEEAPVLRRAHQLLTREGAGTVVGVAVDDTRKNTAAFAAEHRLTFPIVRDVGRRLASSYAVLGLPETFVIDGDGRIVAVERMAFTQRWVDASVAPLVAQR